MLASINHNNYNTHTAQDFSQRDYRKRLFALAELKHTLATVEKEKKHRDTVHALHTHATHHNQTACKRAWHLCPTAREPRYIRTGKLINI